ncbi:MAG: hypothetical protein HON65_08530 [Rhodospirillales bacterium]|nr:hypothetical protein [Rhodospirillales bacterium]
MLEETTRAAEVFALVVAALGVAIVIFSVIAKRNIFVFTAGGLLGAGALMAPVLLRAPPVSVVIVQELGESIEIKEHSGFYGGNYISPDGRQVAIETNRTWGRTATVIVNNTNRLVTITSHLYSQFRIAGGGPPALMSFVLPGHMRIFPRRISFTGSADEGPPHEITAALSVDFILYLAYSSKPYDPSLDGYQAELEAKLDAPPGQKQQKLW